MDVLIAILGVIAGVLGVIGGLLPLLTAFRGKHEKPKENSQLSQTGPTPRSKLEV